MIRFLVGKPIGVLISFVAALLLGITAYLLLPTSLLPNIGVPKMMVKVNAANYAANEVEQRLITPIRNSLQQMHGLNEIESTSSEGKGIIRLSLEHGTNTDMGFVEINEKVDMAMNQLPKEIDRPLVSQVDIGDIPIFNLNIISQSKNLSDERLAEISNFAREIIRRRIEQLPEVAMVDITGYTQPEIRVIPKVGYLSALGIDNKLFLQAFQENKVNMGSILVKDGQYQYFLKFSNELQSLSSIENTPLNIAGRLFKLADLAEIRYANTTSRGSFFSNGQRAVNLKIIKQSGAKIDDLKKSMDVLLQHLKYDYPNINFEISQDQTILLNSSINNLWQDLILGGTLAFLMMLVFIRKVRSAILIGITIPLTLGISQLGFHLAGLSLNIVSLGGLILGLGMIIDNSIVVIDNISCYYKNGMDLTEACVYGTNEVVRPLITSVLTNCAVFVPLIFMSGLAGAIFYDQALSIIIGILTSLLVSIILLPPLYKLIYSWRNEQKKEFEISACINVTHWYEYVFKKVFAYPVIACCFVGVLFISAVLLFNLLNKERVPPITRYASDIFIDWNENISVAENEDRIQTLISGIGKGVAETDAWIGEQQFMLPQDNEQSLSQAKLYIRVKQASDLGAFTQKISNLCREKYPTALLKIKASKNAFEELFASEQAVLRLNVSDKNGRAMPTIKQAEIFVDSLKNIIPDTDINPVAAYQKITLKINTERALRYQLEVADITERITEILKPTIIDNFQNAQALVPIVLANDSFASINDMLLQSFIRTPANTEIPLSFLVRARKEMDYKYITAGIQGAYYPIDIHTERPEQHLAKIKNLANQPFSKMFSVTYTGSYFQNKRLLKEMANILAVSVLLLYFILAAQFESLIQPLFILVEIPVALSGAFIFIYIANNSINLMSMIGIIIMGGLIINDSILKMDAINQLRKQGVPLLEAIVEGGHKRLKPIIMISLTSIGALLPTLFMSDLGSELQRPLALALIGGMLVGMFVSLFFVPLLYWFIYKRKRLI